MGDCICDFHESDCQGTGMLACRGCGGLIECPGCPMCDDVVPLVRAALSPEGGE